MTFDSWYTQLIADEQEALCKYDVWKAAYEKGYEKGFEEGSEEGYDNGWTDCEEKRL